MNVIILFGFLYFRSNLSDVRMLTTLSVLLGLNLPGNDEEPMDVDPPKPSAPPRRPSPPPQPKPDPDASLPPEQKEVNLCYFIILIFFINEIVI